MIILYHLPEIISHLNHIKVNRNNKNPLLKINALHLFNLSELMYLLVVSEIKDRTIQEILLTLDRVVIDPSELALWTWSIETAAKNMSDNKNDNITFEYFPDEKIIKFYVRDAKSRNDLVKSIQLHLPLIPESVQGFFSVFKYNLKNVKFDTP